jgi:histidine triad (HIT) family protein
VVGRAVPSPAAGPHRRGVRLEHEDATVSCIFCSIVNASAPAHVVYEDDTCVGLLDINPATPGHCLVVPRRHVDDIWDCDGDVFADVARAAHAVAALLRTRLEPEGITLFQANRRAGWQDVFHLHVHVVPRYADDGLVRPWTLSAGSSDSLATVAARLRR